MLRKLHASCYIVVVFLFALLVSSVANAAVIAHWSFEGNANDASGNGHDGTLQNGATATATGADGYGLSLDGINDYVSIDNPLPASIFSTGDYTISGFFKSSAVNKTQDIFAATGASGNHGILIELRPDGALRFLHRVPFGISGGINIFSSIDGLNDGNFHSFTAVTDGGNLELFVDGVSVGTATDTSTFNEDLNVAIGRLGVSHNERYFSGVIDEIKIYNTPPVIEVDIDIKPGSYPNSVNLGSNGNVPVAILGSADFDVTTVDPYTVTLAGAWVLLKGKAQTPMASVEDVNDDGYDDLVVHVDTEALELSEDDTIAVLEGETYDGTFINGVDTVRIVP